MLDPLDIAERWLKEGRRIALATVIETWGSAPRPVGSHLIIDAEGNFEGSVSGGCVEGAVISDSIEVIESGKPRVLEFGVADETAWRVGLSCGGRISVFVEKIEGEGEKHLRAINQMLGARRAVVRVSDIQSGEVAVFAEGEALPENLNVQIERAFRSGKSVKIEVEDQRLFLNAYVPPARIVIIGAVHISQALASIAAVAGFDLTIVDPRTAFATPERFADVDLVADWPDDVLKNRPLDRYCALVAVTHDPKIDDFPLESALKSGCFYVGALGSRKTHTKRVERLKAKGFSDDEIAPIDAPIGLDIGAESPAEIAVAIMGAIIQAFRRRQLP